MLMERFKESVRARMTEYEKSSIGLYQRFKNKVSGFVNDSIENLLNANSIQ